MQSTDKKLKSYNQLKRLTKEEQKNPDAIIADFFDCYHLKDIHELLWDWLEAALCIDVGPYSRGQQRSNLIFLYQRLEELAEATYLIHIKQTTEKAKPKKKK